MGIYAKLKDRLYTPIITEKLEATLLHLLCLHRLLEEKDILTDVTMFSTRLTGLTFRGDVFKTEYLAEPEREIQLSNVEEAYPPLSESIRRGIRGFRRSTVRIEIAWTGKVLDRDTEGVSIVRLSRSTGIKDRGDIEIDLTYIDHPKKEPPYLGEVLTKALEDGILKPEDLELILSNVLHSEKEHGLLHALRSDILKQTAMRKITTLVCLGAGARPLTRPNERVAIAARSPYFIADDIRTFLPEVLREEIKITSNKAKEMLITHREDIERAFRLFSLFRLPMLRPHIDNDEVKGKLVRKLKEQDIFASTSSIVIVHHEPLEIVPLIGAMVFQEALKELMEYVNIDQAWKWLHGS